MYFLFVQGTGPLEHLQAAEHGRFPAFLHEQFLEVQPFVHLQKTISLHAFGTGGGVVRIGLSFPSQSFQPDEVVDGITGTGTSACFQMNV